MNRFYAERLVRLTRMMATINQAVGGGNPQVYRSDSMSKVLGTNFSPILSLVIQDCIDIGLTLSLAQCKRLKAAFEQQLDPAEITRIMFELMLRLEDELEGFIFYNIASRCKDLMLPLPHFGDAVSRVFPTAKIDIDEASACLALERWQGCVFHSMIILEHGLRWLCVDLGIPFPLFEQWHTIIQKIENEINSLNIPKVDTTGRERREFLAGVASHFRLVKDGWRNHVTHGRGQHYTPEASEAIYRSVKHIMSDIADHVEKKRKDFDNKE